MLDVGCGNGISAQVLNEYFSYRVLGVDLSEKIIESSWLLCDSLDIRLVVGDGEKLANIAGGQVFDYVPYNTSIFIFPNLRKRSGKQPDVCAREAQLPFSSIQAIPAKLVKISWPWLSILADRRALGLSPIIQRPDRHRNVNSVYFRSARKFQARI